MFLCGQTVAFGCQLCQSTANAEARISWLYHVVYVTVLSCLVRVGEHIGVLFFLLCKESLGVFVLLGFFCTEHCNGSACSHDGDFSRWPCVVDVGAQLLASHDDMASAVALAQRNGNLGHRGLAVCVEQLCSVQDYGVVFLACAGQEAGHVNEAYDRNVEGVAEAYKACALAACVDVEAPA